MNKRGQVTIFIILAILIVFGVIAFFVISKESKLDTQESLPEEIQEVYNYIENCLIKTAEQGLIEVGKNGGYFSNLNYQYIGNGIPFYLKDNLNLLPSKEKVMEELEYYVDNELFYCAIGIYQTFPNLNFSEGETKSIIKIENNRLKVELKYPLTITKEGIVHQIKDYEIFMKSNLDTIFYVANEIVNMHIEDSDNIQLTALYELGENTEIYIDLMDYESHLLYSLTDFNTQINNGSYTWYFAIE